MNITIDAAVSQKLPGFSLGIIEYEGASVSDSPKMLQGRINFFVEMLRLDRSIETITDIPGVQGWRAAFKKLGIDPSRYRPSSEALLRRLLQGNPFFWVNSAVDVNNFLSVHHALPFGIYDKSTLQGDIVCRIGQDTDRYPGLNGREMDMTSKLLLADELGAFGSPIVDSVRSKVTEASADLIQFLFFHEEIPAEEAEQALGSAARMFTEVNGGTVSNQRILHT
ncbi:B3/B4 domain-containing protein [Brevibacillus fluminis]|uniref:B3/B4 domain-containing protein n=1 Tax=Brevibacillus fluminis TaxID=511487 RepID=UPI003F8B1A01